jgi:hypothetical protein
MKLRLCSLAPRAMFLTILGFAYCLPTFGLTVEPIDIEDAIRSASAIFCGRVMGHRSRWADPSKRWIITDYYFLIEEVILPQGEIKTGNTVAFSYWGGTIDSQTHAVAGLRLPNDGERYVMLVRDNWHKPGFTRL